jgi:HlyD family secretion protein
MLQDSEEISKRSLFPPNFHWLVILGIACMVGIGVGVLYLARLSAAAKHPAITSQLSQPVAPKVNALGRLEPAGDVIKISAPTNPSFGSGSRVAELLVDEGKKVR